MKRYYKKMICLVLIFTFMFPSMLTYGAQAPAKPSAPVITQDIKIQTDKSVKITISNWGSAVKKEYKINEGAWQKYTAPFVLNSNSKVYARGTNKSGVMSAVSVFTVSNIRKLLDKTGVSKQSVSVVKVVYYDINDIEMGNGSGFIVSNDGKVVTNYHVIDMAPKIKVFTSDDKSYNVLGVTAYDVSRDIAVLKLDLKGNENLQAVKLGNSDTLRLGEDIAAIGYPLNLKVTVSFGNISSMNADGGLNRTSRKDIQITAPISGGNSGGPLFNMYGEVVGINYSTIIDAQNINYSIPVNELKPMLQQNNLKQLPDIIKEVYPKMDNSQIESYLMFNYPEYKNDNYTFGFTDIDLIKPSKAPNEIDVYLSLNSYYYGQILLAELEGNKKEAESWIDGIYKSVKEINPDKDVCVVVALNTYFNTRPEGYTDSEAVFDYKLNKWDLYKEKIIYGYNNNIPNAIWY